MKLKILHQKDHSNMIDYNLVLYIGIGLIVFGFVLFLVSEHFERQADIKLFKLKQLEESFRKAKENERL